MATISSRTSHDTHSTTATSGWSTRRLAVTAFFCALSFVLTFVEIPIFPPAPYLTFDPSGIVAFVAAYAFGPSMGALVCVITWVVRTLFSFNPYGHLMAILATVTLVVPAVLVWKRSQDTKGLVAGMVLGSVISIVACVLGNLVVTPLYTAVSVEDVMAMIVPILVPFNLIKVALSCVVTALVRKPIQKLIGE